MSFFNFFAMFVGFFLVSLVYLGIDYLILVVVFGVSKGWIAGWVTFGILVKSLWSRRRQNWGHRWYGFVFLASFIAYIWVLP